MDFYWICYIMNVLKEWSAFGSAITGAIIGGAMAGFFTMRATKKSFAHQQLQSKKQDDRIIKGLLQALHNESETVLERYEATMGRFIEELPEGEPLNIYYPIVSEFFNVYNGNTSLIGHVPDNNLRKQIIKAYTLSKGVIDSYRMNNELVHKFEQAHKLTQETGLKVHADYAQAIWESMIEYAIVLKESDREMKEELEKMLSLLESAVSDDFSN